MPRHPGLVSRRLASLRLAVAAAALLLGGCGGATPAPLIDVTPVGPPRTSPSSESSTDTASASAGRAPPKLEVAGGDAGDERSPGTRRIEGQGFHYDIPADWEDLDATTLGSPLIRTAQRSLRSTAGFRQNVNIASEPFALDGPSYGSANLAELIKVSTIRDQRPASAGPRPGMDIEAYWPNPSGVPYITLQRYATNGSEGFVITCSTGESVFGAQREICDVVLDSFRVD